MSRHWKPPSEKIVRVRPAGGKRLRSLDEFEAGLCRPLETAATREARPVAGRSQSWLILIAAACIGVAIGAYQVLGPRDVVADEVASR
jgi:hypothetical protein